MSYSYKLKSHPTQSLYDHLTGVRDIALKTHKYHTIKPEIDDFIEIVCMCHDFGKGTTYFQRYLENDIRVIFVLDGTPVRFIIRERGEGNK